MKEEQVQEIPKSEIFKEMMRQRGDNTFFHACVALSSLQVNLLKISTTEGKVPNSHIADLISDARFGLDVIEHFWGIEELCRKMLDEKIDAAKRDYTNGDDLLDGWGP